MVSKLDIPDYTKHFVLGIREPESGALAYILCVHGFSERSARDVEHLIRAVRTDVVLADGDWNWYVEYWEYDHRDSPDEPIPTSTFRAFRDCLKDQLAVYRYLKVARNLVLQEIFGVGYYENYIAAKKTAEEVGCLFLMFPPNKYPYRDPITKPNIYREPPKLASSIYSLSDTESYKPPHYSLSLYRVLDSLSNDFSMDTTLACARKMLDDVGNGANVDPQDLFQCCNFRVAVEANRFSLHRDGINPYAIGTEKVIKYSELSAYEMFNCILAQGIKDQAKKSNKIVAIVDSTSFSHLRRFWNTSVPENESAVGGFFVGYEDSGVSVPLVKKQKKIPTAPALAGVTALLAGSLLFKEELITPVCRFMKRKRGVFMPLYICAACTGLLLYAQGIQDSSSVVRLGRGIQSIQQASQEIRQYSRPYVDQVKEDLIV